MSDENSLEWGLLSRLVVAVFAAMVVAIAAKPYEGKFDRIVQQAKSTALKGVNFELPRKREAATVPAPLSLQTKKDSKSESKVEQDRLTDKDKKALNNVLDGL